MTSRRYVVIGGGAVWKFWPRPIEPLSLSDVQNTYAGMVRADGTNDEGCIQYQKNNCVYGTSFGTPTA